MEVTMRLALFFIITATFISSSLAEKKEAVVGETVRLACRLGVNDSRDLEWKYRFNLTDAFEKLKIIYRRNKVQSSYNERFNVTRDDIIGQYDLVISNVTLGDAGRYTCDINRVNLSVDLIVFDKYPSDKFCWIQQPSNVLDSNGCVNDSTPIYTLSCNLSYRGNVSIAPSLQWRRGELPWPQDDEVIVKSNGTTISTIRTSLTVKDTISCQIIYPSDRGALYHHSSTLKKWTPPAVVTTLTYTNITEDGCNHDTLTCDIKLSYNCSYSWEDEKGKLVGECFTLKPPTTENKTYLCVATCGQYPRRERRVVKRVSYNCTAKESPQFGTPEDGNTIIALTVAVSIFCVAIIALIAFVLLRRRRRQQQSSTVDHLNTTDTEKPVNESNENTTMV